MKRVTMKLIDLCSIEKVCMLGGKVSKNNPFTYHHIKPVREGGKRTLENGAILTKSKHEEFNRLEVLYPELANEVNQYMYFFRGDYPEPIKDRIDNIMILVKFKG